jgi:choline-sulfatase
LRIRGSAIISRSTGRSRGTRLLPAAAFLLASCARAPEAGKALDAAAVAVAVAGPAPAPAAPPDASGYRTAFDFIANRVHAVSHRDGRLVVDAGALDFLKYVDGGWKTSWLLGRQDEHKPASLVVGVSAMAFLPIDRDGDGAGGAAMGPSTLSITMRSLAPAQKVSIFVNEKPVGTLDVAVTKKRYDIAVPADVTHLGDNRVRLTFKSAANVPTADMLTDIHTPIPRSAAAIQQIALGPAGLGPAPVDLAIAEARDVTVGGVARRALVSGGHGGRISYYVQLPAGAHLAVGLGGEGNGTATGGSALVRVAVDGQPTRTLHEGPVSARWNDLLLDCGAAAGHAARIDFVARGGAVAWAEPRVVVKAPPHVAPPSPQPRFDHIYVWMVDTFRADKMHAYNPKTRVLTPNYDAFAADATRFAWATVQGTWSLPSHASLLTGVYPTVHRATAADSKLSPTVPFVAEELKHDGYRTGMFSSNGYISAKWGFDRGWDINRNFIRESLPNGADYLWKTAKTWLTPLLSKRQFLYLATIEPHVAYTPKKEFLVKYWDKPYVGPLKPVLTGVQLGLIKGGKLKINDNDKAYLEALHDAEITGSDALFAKFISDLKALGVYDTSVVIVVSDHGDQFYEHGSVGHGDTVYQELTHVPMIIRAPGLLPRGTVVEGDVEMMDIAPTLLDLAGAKPDPKMQGATLVPLVFDEVGVAPRAALTVDGQVARGLKVDRYRLIHKGPGRMELYDEFADPREQKDVAADHPIALRGMRGVLGLLHAYETTWSKARWGTAANVSEAFYAGAGLPGHLGVEPKTTGPK